VPVFTFNGGATALSGGTSPNNFNQFADFLLGLPQSRNAQVLTPLLDTGGAKGAEWPATVRGWAPGLSLRDQWQMTPKMTASIGVRWEDYPFPTRTDRGLEMFDFTTNLLQVCGLGAANPEVCNIKVQKDLFTPRLGWAYRPTEDTVIRVGFSRNPQSDNAITRRGDRAGIPADYRDYPIRPNTFTPVGSLSRVYRWCRISTSRAASVRLPPVRRPTLEGEFTGARSRRGTSPCRSSSRIRSVQVEHVANRQTTRRPVRPQLRPDRRRGSEPAVQPARPGQRPPHDGCDDRLPAVGQNYLRFAAAQCHAPDDSGLPVHLGLHLRTGHRLVGRQHRDPGVLPSEQSHAGSGAFQAARLGTSTPHKVDASVIYQLPFGPDRTFLNSGGALAAIAGGWQVSSTFTAYSGAPFTVTSSTASLNAPGNPQLADQLRDDVEIFGYNGSNEGSSDVGLPAGHRARFGTAVQQPAGAGGAKCRPERQPHACHGRARTLQLKIDVYNLFNRPTFANPGNLNVSNLQLNPDGSVRNLNGFGVINSTQNAGREYAGTLRPCRPADGVLA
jgi:hypothetical protein